MRQVLAMYPLASAMRYGPFLAGYWNSLVLPAHGAKHWASELGSDTTLGGAAVASPAAKSALRAAAHGRYSIKASFDQEFRLVGSKRKIASCSWTDRPTPGRPPREDALDQVMLQVPGIEGRGVRVPCRLRARARVRACTEANKVLDDRRRLGRASDIRKVQEKWAEGLLW